MSLDIHIIKKNEHVYTVVLNGSLDPITYADFEQKIAAVIDDDIKAIVLDMEGVDYVSSAGIGVIVKIQQDLKEKYATFAMIKMQSKIKRIFDVMNLLPILKIFEDMPEADKYIDEIINEEMKKELA